MKVKVLISYYPQEGGHELHRAYFERDYEQAQSDLDLINGTNPNKSLELLEVGIFGNHTEIISRQKS
jgi:hypothetical protein